MKQLILAGLVVSALSALPAVAQTDNTTVRSESITALVNAITSADPATTPEQLQANTLAAIQAVCGDCSPEQIDTMISAVVAAIGADSPLISGFISALAAAGVDGDAITLAAITAGVDATTASEATAAGPTQSAPAAPAPAVVSLPPTPIPQGAGGTGGDAGISEIGNN